MALEDISMVEDLSGVNFARMSADGDLILKAGANVRKGTSSSVTADQFAIPVNCNAPSVAGMLASGIIMPAAGTLGGIRLAFATAPSSAGDAFSINVNVGAQDEAPLEIFSSDQAIAKNEVPTDFLVSLDSGATFTSYLTEISGAGHAQLDALDTVGNGDAFYIGYSDPFFSVRVTMVGGQVNAETNTLAAHYWNGSAWTSITVASDGTASGGATLAQTGVIGLTQPADGNWVKSTLNDVEAYWIRFSVSAACSATTSVDTVTVDRLANHYFTFAADQNTAFAEGDEVRIICTEVDANAAGLHAIVFGNY